MLNHYKISPFLVILFSGWVSVVIVSLFLPLYHIYSGDYSNLLDGVIQGDYFKAMTGFMLLNFIGVTLLFIPIFMIIFLIFYLIFRKRVNVSLYSVSVCSLAYFVIYIILTDLTRIRSDYSTIINIFLFCLPIIILNIFIFRKEFFHIFKW